MMMTGAKILVGVVGVGYLGKFHAEKYAASNKATLVGVVDVNEERALEIAKNLRTQALTDYRQLFGQVQCVSIAVPTQLHYRIARDFLEAGVDVLVEKPLTQDIAGLVRSPVKRVEAVGVPVLTDKPDIANARIAFADGCIANVTSSRVSMKRERKVRFFQPDAYISIDYDQRRAQIFHKPPPGAGWLDIRGENIEIKEGDALADEIDSFLNCVRTRALPLVSGLEGLRALEIASMISSQL